MRQAHNTTLHTCEIQKETDRQRKPIMCDCIFVFMCERTKKYCYCWCFLLLFMKLSLSLAIVLSLDHLNLLLMSPFLTFVTFIILYSKSECMFLIVHHNSAQFGFFRTIIYRTQNLHVCLCVCVFLWLCFRLNENRIEQQYRHEMKQEDDQRHTNIYCAICS